MSIKQNILIFAGSDHVALQFLNDFIPQVIERGFNPIIFYVQNRGHDFHHTEMRRYAFYEDTILNEHIIPFIENNKSPIYKLLSFRQLAETYDLQTINIKSVNAPEVISIINSMEYIGAISIRCFQIFKAAIINAVKQKGFFCNSHPGLVPDYRGVLCMLRGIIANENNLGWTLHDIDENIDTGDVIQQVTIKNDGSKDFFRLMAQSLPLLRDGWLDFISRINMSEAVCKTPQAKTGNYYTYPNDKEIDGWLQSGALNPINPKSIVQYYCDLFYDDRDKFSSAAQEFKVKLINRIAQFETMLEMEIYAVNKQDKKAA